MLKIAFFFGARALIWAPCPHTGTSSRGSTQAPWPGTGTSLNRFSSVPAADSKFVANFLIVNTFSKLFMNIFSSGHWRVWTTSILVSGLRHQLWTGPQLLKKKSFTSLIGVIIQVSVVLKMTVAGDNSCFDNLSGSHLHLDSEFDFCLACWNIGQCPHQHFFRTTVKPPVSWDIWDQALLSAYGRCLLTRGWKLQNTIGGRGWQSAF